ncbi:MAG: T9SS type A sorting domain-containing protein [Candidatus Eisenbacteria bacterium]|uniref:T9SS type A sorting domain-containing protein n=1 Tax=Eiseniibacteriota bacterium TaxID=2212470 RepID=A0A956NEV4_UNCEI|nr:T9SS type A sorting domain-containing protein [Candidatus Eisenbacteria bacterium]MCB9464254.1 T9SS type A sorting domain-containing protein [Candidatus Eisenbacteria bacterium]
MLRLPTIVAAVTGLLALAGPSAGQDWTAAADMPGSGRHHPVNFTLDGYGYVVTGSSGGNTADFFRYDPNVNQWEVLPDFPGPARSYSYGGAYDGKGYLACGLGSAYFNDLWEYDPDTGNWTQLASLPGVGRTHPAFVITDDGKIFIGMGGASSGNLRDWWEYDIATDQWVQRDNLPGPNRHHPYYFNIGDTPYVGFGHGAAIFNDFYKFDRGTNTWVQMADFPGEGRVAGTQFSYGGKGYILSGEGEDHQQLDTGEFWEYEASTDTWTALPAHPGSGRWAPGNFVIGDTVYFMGGLSTTRLEFDMWTYQFTDPAGVGEWSPSSIAFRVAPNPVTGTQLRIEELPAEASALHLLDAQGRQVARLDAAREEVTLPEGIAAGTYFLQLVDATGRTASQRLTVLR